MAICKWRTCPSIHLFPQSKILLVSNGWITNAMLIFTALGSRCVWLVHKQYVMNRRMVVGWTVSDELWTMWKELAWSILTHYPSICFAEETQGISKSEQPPGQDSNPGVRRVIDTCSACVSRSSHCIQMVVDRWQKCLNRYCKHNMRPEL